LREEVGENLAVWQKPFTSNDLCAKIDALAAVDRDISGTIVP
jgi:hypothetical protein